MNTVFVAHEIVHAVWKALAEADPSRSLAGWSKTVHGHVAGYDDQAGTWVMYHWHAMGTPGATAERDGFCQMGHLITLGGLDLPNLEFHEQHFPVTYRRWELRTDAAGPGTRRGGTGVIYEADVDVDALWSFRAEGLDTPSGYGVLGGGAGAVGQEWIEPRFATTDGARFIPPKYGVRRLGPARMIAHTPGGGGWGRSAQPRPRAGAARRARRRRVNRGRSPRLRRRLDRRRALGRSCRHRGAAGRRPGLRPDQGSAPRVDSRCWFRSASSPAAWPSK